MKLQKQEPSMIDLIADVFGIGTKETIEEKHIRHTSCKALREAKETKEEKDGSLKDDLYVLLDTVAKAFPTMTAAEFNDKWAKPFKAASKEGKSSKELFDCVLKACEAGDASIFTSCTSCKEGQCNKAIKEGIEDYSFQVHYTDTSDEEAATQNDYYVYYDSVFNTEAEAENFANKLMNNFNCRSLEINKIYNDDPREERAETLKAWKLNNHGNWIEQKL